MMKKAGTFISTNFWTSLFVYGDISIDETTLTITYKGTYRSGQTAEMEGKWTGDTTARMVDKASDQTLDITMNSDMDSGTYISTNPYDIGSFVFNRVNKCFHP